MAARYLISAGTGNWNSTTNWSATSGGASGASFPVSTDDVILDGLSNADITVNVTSAALSFSASPTYINSLIVNGQLSVSRDVTLSSGMTITTSSGTPRLRNVTSSGLYTSNGTIWPYDLFLNGTATSVTLADNWTVGSLTINNNASLVQTLSANTLYVLGNLTEGTNVVKFGSTTIVLSGTGTWSNSSTGNLQIPVTISGAYTISGVVRQSISPFIIISAATLTTAGSTIVKSAGEFTNNNSAITLNSLTTTSALIGGDYGFSMNRFTCATVGSRIGWKSENQYIINTGLTITATAASPIAFSANTPSSKSIVMLSQGAIQDIDFLNVTDIDNSAGQTIWTYKGTISNSSNINLMPTQPQAISSIY